MLKHVEDYGVEQEVTTGEPPAPAEQVDVESTAPANIESFGQALCNLQASVNAIEVCLRNENHALITIILSDSDCTPSTAFR